MTALGTKPPTTAAGATDTSRAATCAARSKRFAREIAHRLDAGLAAGEFSALWLFASSPFLGELKAQLSDAVNKRVHLALDSDLTALGLAEIEQRLLERG